MISLTSTDWHAVAVEFCKANNSQDVALIENAIKHGASIAVSSLTERLSEVKAEVIEKRLKANKPQ